MLRFWRMYLLLHNVFSVFIYFQEDDSSPSGAGSAFPAADPAGPLEVSLGLQSGNHKQSGLRAAEGPFLTPDSDS